MDIHILSLFPEMFRGPFQESIVKRAVDRDLVKVHIYNIRDYAQDRHRIVDDTPFGGGGGMVLKPEPLCATGAPAVTLLSADAGCYISCFHIFFMIV